MEREKAISVLYGTVKNKRRHSCYQRTTELAGHYGRLITGRGLDGLMKQFANRESDEMFEQRKELTQHVVTAVTKNLMDVAFKVPRSASAQRVLAYKGDDTAQRAVELEGVLSRFWGSYSFDDYLATRFIELNYTDPNAFVVFEFGPYDEEKERPQPYPFEVSSHMAINYQHTNNILDYLIVKTEMETDSRDESANTASIPMLPGYRNTAKATGKSKKMERYTMYTPDFTLVLNELASNQAPRMNEDGEKEQEGRVFVRLDGKSFELLSPEPHYAGQTPAIRVGYVRDLYTDGHSFVNPFHAALPYLEKTIKVVSEMDLTMAMHAFPQKIQYVTPCRNEGCQGGYLPDGAVCPVCKGTGMNTNTSAQDAILLQMPRDKEEMLDLNNIIKYVYPPTDLLRFQNEYINQLTEQCRRVVFNSDIFSHKEISETATGKNIALQNVYDTLYPLALKFARTWQAGVRIISRFAGLDEGLVHSYRFSKDFKFKTKGDYMAELEAAQRSGANPYIIREIENEIMRLDHSENPEEYRRYLVQQSFNPFSNKSRDEIKAILNSDLTTPYNKVLYTHLGVIFDELEMEHAINGDDFYQLNRDEQASLIREKTNRILMELPAAGIGNKDRF